MVDTKLIKELREKTQAGIGDIRAALEEAKNDPKKAEALLKQKGLDAAAKKADRKTSQGVVEAYIHAGGKVGVIVTVKCETDFVAKTDQFKTLAHEVAMQIAAMNPKNTEELLKQEYIRDASKTIDKLVKETIGVLGENIAIGDFSRLEVGR